MGDMEFSVTFTRILTTNRGKQKNTSKDGRLLISSGKGTLYDENNKKLDYFSVTLGDTSEPIKTGKFEILLEEGLCEESKKMFKPLVNIKPLFKPFVKVKPLFKPLVKVKPLFKPFVTVKRLVKSEIKEKYQYCAEKCPRSFRIPNTFDCKESYKKAYLTAIHEHVQATLSEHAAANHKAIDCTLEHVYDDYYELTLNDHIKTIDELWVVSPTETFSTCWIFKSNKSNCTCITLKQLDKYDIPNGNVFAKRVARITELGIKDIYDNLNQIPLIETLIDPMKIEPKVENFGNPDKYQVIVDTVLRSHELNEDQKKVARTWAFNIRTKEKSITLVHGVFGSGKSHLCAILVLLFCAITDSSNILLASNTNVAVDRILECLLDLNFDEFARVGNKLKMKSCMVKYNDIEKRVIATTCLSTMQPVLAGKVFEYLILDECSQFTEPIALLPLKMGVNHLLCFGDPLQLPPTVTSRCLHNDHLEKTLFSRLEQAGVPVLTLWTQYRCHPAIATIPSTLFYSGKIKMGSTCKSLIPKLPPVSFFNIKGTELLDDKGYSNELEANACVAFYNHVVKHISPEDIGIITAYKNQVKLLTSLLPNCDSLISTVDAFQGSERAVIILSCVRTKSIGVSADPRRVNVMLTRAKNHLCIFGYEPFLNLNELWAKVIQGTMPKNPMDFN